MRILLTGAGGPSAISVWKSLAGAHELHMADMDPCAAGLYLVPPAQRLLVPRGDAPQFVDQLLQACRERGIDLLIPTVDAELVPLAQARSRFDEAGIRLALAPLECLQLCRDKHRLLTALRDVVPVPRSELLTADVAAAADGFRHSPSRAAPPARAVPSWCAAATSCPRCRRTARICCRNCCPARNIRSTCMSAARDGSSPPCRGNA